MRGWHSLFEVFRFPLAVLVLGFVLLGLGNLAVNEAFASLYSVSSDFVLILGHIFSRLGTFLVVNFPLFFLMRLVAKKSGSATTMISALAGYVAYLVVTMYFAPSGLSSTAFSSILGLSMTQTNSLTLTTSVHYPLQTGLIATAVTGLVTLWCFSRSRPRSEYSFMPFISRDVWCVITTIFWCMVGALLVTEGWSYVLKGLEVCLDFIASDTTNPVNLALYGVMDRFLSTLNLAVLIRTPFWYGSSGGNWVSMAGSNIAGDVSIWTAQFAAGSISGMAGRFITPYYVLNLFAIPGLLIAAASLQTDRLGRRRMRSGVILLVLVSLFSGTLLPVEIGMLFLCPLLYLFHLGLTGILFGVLQAMHVYLGFQCTTNLTMTALPGTLMEFLVYARDPSLVGMVGKVLIVGVVYFFLYFFVTRLYFEHAAIDIFHTGGVERTVKAVLAGVGGVENIKLVHSSVSRLMIWLYEPGKLDVDTLRAAGGMRVVETKSGFAISFGAASTMIRRGIEKEIQQSVRRV
jgi:PTS system maltose and glucose-specific IIC component